MSLTGYERESNRKWRGRPLLDCPLQAVTTCLTLTSKKGGEDSFVDSLVQVGDTGLSRCRSNNCLLLAMCGGKARFPYLSLIKASILDGAVWFVERLKGVGHVPVPQSGLLLVGDAEQFPHLLLYHVCRKHTKKGLLPHLIPAREVSS